MPEKWRRELRSKAAIQVRLRKPNAGRLIKEGKCFPLLHRQRLVKRREESATVLGAAIRGFGSGLKERTAQARRYDPYEASNMYIEPSERWCSFSEDQLERKNMRICEKKIYTGREENDNCLHGRRNEREGKGKQVEEDASESAWGECEEANITGSEKGTRARVPGREERKKRKNNQGKEKSGEEESRVQDSFYYTTCAADRWRWIMYRGFLRGSCTHARE